MRSLNTSLVILVTALSLSFPTAAVDIQWHGFLSVVAGRTTDDARLTDGSKSTYAADTPSNGIYPNYWTLEPDTIYGLQGIASLDHGLSVTAQVTGAGGQDFDAQIRWAYLSYELNDIYTIQAGRQRIPTFLYSDYLDVGYAYHWIRPPTEIYAPAADVFEGVKIMASVPLGNWDSEFQLYAGKADNNDINSIQPASLMNMVGVVMSFRNDWLELRTNYLRTNNASEDASRGGVPQDTESGGVPLQFAGIAANARFGQAFVGAEIIAARWDEAIAPDQGLGFTKWDAHYITAGYQVGTITPHITYGRFSVTEEDNFIFGGVGIAPPVDIKTTSWTVGLRWDFHPNATFKAEYLTRNDDSDNMLVNVLGEVQRVDLVSFGVDVVY